MNAQEKLNEAIKTKNLELLQEAIDEGCIFDNEPFASDQVSPNRKNTLYQAIESNVSKEFFEKLLDSGAKIAKVASSYKTGDDYLYYRYCDTFFHAMHRHGENREEIASLILDRSEPEVSKFGTLYQTLRHSDCSAKLVEKIIKKGAEVQNTSIVEQITRYKGGQTTVERVSKDYEVDSLLQVLGSYNTRTDSSRAEICEVLFRHGAKIYQGEESPEVDTLYRALDNRMNGIQTIFSLFRNGATTNQETYNCLKLAMLPRNFREEVAQFLVIQGAKVNNFSSARDNTLYIAVDNLRASDKFLDTLIKYGADPKLMPNHARKENLINRKQELKKEVVDHNYGVVSAMAQKENLPATVAAKISAFAIDNGFGKNSPEISIFSSVEKLHKFEMRRIKTESFAKKQRLRTDAKARVIDESEREK